MNIKRIVWIALAAAAIACGQADSSKIVPKIIPIHHADVNRLRDLVSIPGVQVKADTGMRVLVVTGPPDAVATIEEMVKKLDIQPPPEPKVPDFELTGYLVAGSSQPHAEDLPPALTTTVKQLRSVFNYKSYRVMDTFVIHGEVNMHGNSSASGILPGTLNSVYYFRFDSAQIRASNPPTVSFTGLDLTIRTPNGERDKEGRPMTRDVGIRTAVEVPEGQMVVVGKSNFTGGDDALILVLSVKVIQ